MRVLVGAFVALVGIAGPQAARAMPGDADQVNLGTVWNESEAGWQGTWQRVGKSNQFRAVWTKGSKPVVRADLTVTVKGINVSIVRRDTAGGGVGKGCVYTGRVQGASAGGTYRCDWMTAPLTWKASIAGQ